MTNIKNADSSWKKQFAWFPVLTIDAGWIWLKTVFRHKIDWGTVPKNCQITLGPGESKKWWYRVHVPL